MTVAEQVVKGLVASDGLVLAEGGEQIRELVLGNFEFADGAGESHEHGMARIAGVAGIQFRFPLIEQLQGCRRISGFVTQVVGGAAVSVHVEEMLAKALGKKPGSN